MADPQADNMNLAAGLLAILFPGAGHFLVLGEKRRGVLAAVGVLGLFFGGLLIGGIDVVDRQEDQWWFLGQALVGPVAFGVNQIHQTEFKAYEMPEGIVEGGLLDPRTLATFHKRSLYPQETREMVEFKIKSATGATVTKSLPVARAAGAGQGPRAMKSVGKMNELGMLSSTLGGMLNFIVLLDALFPRRKERAE